MSSMIHTCNPVLRLALASPLSLHAECNFPSREQLDIIPANIVDELDSLIELLNDFKIIGTGRTIPLFECRKMKSGKFIGNENRATWKTLTLFSAAFDYYCHMTIIIIVIWRRTEFKPLQINSAQWAAPDPLLN